MHFRTPLYNSVTPPRLLWVSDELNNLYLKGYRSEKRKCTGETTKIFLLLFLYQKMTRETGIQTVLDA